MYPRLLRLLLPPPCNVAGFALCRNRSGVQVGALLQGAAELALMLSAASSGIMGISVAVVELKRGACRGSEGGGAACHSKSTLWVWFCTTPRQQLRRLEHTQT